MSPGVLVMAQLKCRATLRRFANAFFIFQTALVLLTAPAVAQETPTGKAKRRAEALADLTKREWTIDGTTREALVHIPAASAPKPYPLVFAFHGHGGTMQNAAATFDYHQVWPEAVVVYMQGLNTPGRLTDPEGKKSGWQHSTGFQGDRDLKFFDTVLASLKSDTTVDDRRIYSTGHSNGGGFTYLLWRTRGDVFAAMAPSAAAGPGEGWLKNIAALKPKPVMHLAGEMDPLVKYDWQKETIQTLIKLNGCDEKGVEWAPQCTLYQSKTGTPVVKLIHSGGHNFPAEAPALFVKFFKEHAKP
jgi:polyhydroxybutyrate depolymerase